MSLLAKVRLEAEGLNLCRALIEIEKVGVELFDVGFVEKKRITFCVKRKDCAKVVAYLKKKCYNVKIIGGVGLYGFLKSVKKHALAFIFVFVAVASAFFLGGVCLDVEINAPQDMTEDIVEALAEIGVKRGCAMRSVNLDRVENALCVALPDVKYAFAAKKGSTLFITVEKLSDAPLPNDLKEKKDVVSSCDGVVTRISVVNGTPLVKAGDTIKKGQVLIRGENVFADGTSETATAIGEVWTNTEYSFSVRFSPEVVETTVTGNVLKRKRLKIFNYVTPYDKKIEFGEYSVQTTTKRLFPLGITVEYETVYETETVVRKNTLDSCLEKLKAQAYDGLKEVTGSNQLQGVTYAVHTAGNETFVTAKVIIEQNAANGG